MSQQGPIFRVVQAADMPLGNHQHVDRRLRVDVLEREHLVVLQDDLGRNLPGADLAKETIRHESLPPRLFFFESAFAEPPGQLLVDLGRWNLVIAERDQQMKQEVRRLVHDLLALLPFGSEDHFPASSVTFFKTLSWPALSSEAT